MSADVLAAKAAAAQGQPAAPPESDSDKLARFARDVLSSPFIAFTRLVNTVAPGTAPHVTGVTPSGQVTTGPPSEGLPSSIISLADDLQRALTDPKKLPDYLRTLYGVIILAASALSFIPGTNNFGGALASVMIHDILDPFRRAVYEGTIDLALRPLFPTGDLNARLLVSGIEAGALTEDDLTSELARSGTRDDAINLALQIARVKRFDVETKDDIALARQYERDVYTFTVQVLQDQEKEVLTELRAQKAAAITELAKIQGSRLSALQASAGG